MATVEELMDLMMAKLEAEETEDGEEVPGLDDVPEELITQRADAFVCRCCGGLHIAHRNEGGDILSVLCIDTPEEVQKMIDHLIHSRDEMVVLQAAGETKQ